MTEFAKSSDKVDQIVRDSTNFEAMREAIKQQMALEGVISRDSETQGYGVTRLRGDGPVANASILPASGYEFEETFNYAPESGRRSLRLRTHIQADLDALRREMEKTV